MKDTTTDRLLARASELVALGESCRGGGGRLYEFRAASSSFIHALYGHDHPLSAQLRSSYTGPHGDVANRIGVMQAAAAEIAGGWLDSLRGLLSADIFADFLEMAEHLIDEKYHQPAAVLIGSVLEEHLRQLAASSDVETTTAQNGKTVPKKADRLNADLRNADVYNLLDQKSITAWLELRNKAAHGQHDQYDLPQVRLMLEGVRAFMMRVRP